MAIVTFTSDFGHSDHYVAAVKARLLSLNPAVKIVDISHEIEPFGIAHMAFVLRSVFRDFPEGTIHLLGINEAQAKQGAYLAAKIENHFFIGPDNGILSLISDKDPEEIIQLIPETHSIFPLKESYGQSIDQLMKGSPLSSLGKPAGDFKQLMLRQPRATKKEISGHVIHVDHYGNLITNIKKLDFDILSRNKDYTIRFGRDAVSKINRHYHEVEPGEVFFLFNSNGLLEIGIVEGNASSLLGLNYDSPILIQFEE